MKYRDEDERAGAPAGPMPTIFEAIVKSHCLNATWNRDKVVLAPHIVYTRHGELFVDAITIARNNMLSKEEKLGTFKVAGLGDVKLSTRTFAVNALFEPEAERYAGVTLIAVDPAPAEA